ncbi:MAG: DNA internalization-related competence protein ComEC/Rec2 [Clostridia bacterium]|nr:DNA internalization-related competence protein ComEC/Rec2 [Clostridia bacterium]
MKRPLLWFAVSLVTGILFSYLTDSYAAISASIATLTLIMGVFYFKFRKTVFIFAGILLFYALGAIEFHYVSQVNKTMYSEFVGKEVIIRGIIDSEPDIRDAKIMYVVKTQTIESPELKKDVKGKILLTTLRNKDTYTFQYGNGITIKGILNLPSGKRNPGGFDYRRYLSQSGISATVFGNREDIEIQSDFNGNFFVKAGFTLRNKIVHVINQSLPREQAGLLNGMLIGYRGGLDKEMQESFSNAGLSHLMAVSGMNVAFIVIPLVFLFRKLTLKQRTANSIIILVLILFVFITGFSPSVVRAVIMGIIILLGQIIRREPDIYTSIAFAAVLILVYNPGSLFDIGFQLSFIATLSLVMFYSQIKKFITAKFIPDFIKDVLAATLAATVGTLPITAFYFNKISVISVVSNLLAVPLVQIITILGFAMAITGQVSGWLAEMIGYINSTLLSFILLVTKTSSKLPWAVVRVVTPSLFSVLLYYGIAFFFLWYKPLYQIKVQFKHYAAVILVLLTVKGLGMLTPKGLEVVFIDVGQGDSALVKTYTGKTVLIDGGGFSSKMNRDSDMGKTVVIPFLLDYGISELDMVVATHGHDDHLQGLISVLKDFNVRNLVVPHVKEAKEFNLALDIAKSNDILVKDVKKGDTIVLDNKTYFDVINPDKAVNADESSLNNTSVVLKLCYKETSVLFTGDMEKGLEEKLIAEIGKIDADVLKVGHHGSVTSSCEEFLESVMPKAAVISVGKNNFGHPSKVVVKRLADRKIETFRTDRDGAVIMKSDGEKIRFTKTIHGENE